MEWVVTTARTVDEAKDLALEQLGVIADDAEFEVLEAPRQGLFGRLRGEAKVRARVRPTPVRPKQDRRRGRRSGGSGKAADGAEPTSSAEPDGADTPANAAAARQGRRPRRQGGRNGQPAAATTRPAAPGGTAMSLDDRPSAEEPPADDAAADVDDVDVDSVRQAALEFVTGLTSAFGLETSVDAAVDGNEIEVRVDGASLGLLIGPGGRTLLGIQDLARVAAQRRLGDHDTRLRVDIAGYREKRRQALERFAGTVAEQVRASGVARSLDPMPSADRKILHDALAAIDGVTSRSEGEDPNRRVVVAPA
jgi:spoIIIJ-associated protein